MKGRRLVFAAFTLALSIAGAHAADLGGRGQSYGRSVVYGGYNWTGFYAGVNAGYSWGSVDNTPTRPSGPIGGIQGGYNHQWNQFVLGLEADMQLSGADDTVGAVSFTNRWFGTIRGRAGFAMNNVLAYGTGGFAFGGGRLELGAFEESQTHIGWTAGAGLEVGLAPRWTAKAEFLYVGLGDERYALSGQNHSIDSAVVRLGANFRF